MVYACHTPAEGCVLELIPKLIQLSNTLLVCPQILSIDSKYFLYPQIKYAHYRVFSGNRNIFKSIQNSASGQNLGQVLEIYEVPSEVNKF